MPLEQHNLAPDQPELAARLQRELEAALGACRPVGEALEVEPDAEASRALGELGYTEHERGGGQGEVGEEHRGRAR